MSKVCFTNYLRLIRESRGLSITKTARLAGMDPSQLCRIEHGEASMTLDTFLRLCHVLKIVHVLKVLEPFVQESQHVTDPRV